MSTGNNVAALTRVILTWPSVLNLKDVTDVAAPRSWIQLAKTGAFVSKRYGAFAITREDLASMLHNFNNVTPKAPTELPIDFDHLSMDPKKPGDGMAAGWMKKLELREGGDELWAEVEWTDDGADRIRRKEYRFISPSFIKDHVHKDGSKIGTTLLAAAITNHPFLEGMKALTLYNASAIGDLALNEHAPALSLSEVGQRVSIKTADELTPDERAMTFVIAEVRGTGDDEFVFLQTVDRAPFGWFRARQLAPARITPDPIKEEVAMSNTTNDPGQTILARAQQIVSERHISLAAATKAASAELSETSAVWLARPETEPSPQPVMQLNAQPGETFDDLCERTAREKRIDLRDAVHAVSLAYPQLAETRG